MARHRKRGGGTNAGASTVDVDGSVLDVVGTDGMRDLWVFSLRFFLSVETSKERLR
jgi:hypothetical protein